MDWRFLVMESTQLARPKAPRLTAMEQTERAMLAALQERWQRWAFACEADAHQAAILCRRELSLHSHHLTYTVAPEWGPRQAGRAGTAAHGFLASPAPGVAGPLGGQEATEAITTQAQRERRFALATDVLDGQQLTDADLLRAYKGQPAVELSFKWARTQRPLRPSSWRPRLDCGAGPRVPDRAAGVRPHPAASSQKPCDARGNLTPSPRSQPAPHCPHRVPAHAQHCRRDPGAVGQCHRQVTALSPVQLRVVGLLGYDASTCTAAPKFRLIHPTTLLTSSACPAIWRRYCFTSVESSVRCWPSSSRHGTTPGRGISCPWGIQDPLGGQRLARVLFPRVLSRVNSPALGHRGYHNIIRNVCPSENCP